MSVITAQYMSYIELMQALELELAAEYLLMAAMLAEIKSRMLLPRPEEFDDEDDPRTELIRRLQEYEQIKIAAEDLNAVPRWKEMYSLAPPVSLSWCANTASQTWTFARCCLSLAQVLSRAEMFTKHEIKFEALSVRDRMGDILSQVSQRDGFIGYNELLRAEEGRLGVVVTFLAIMELIRESLVDFVQAEPFAPIHVRVGQNATQGLGDKSDVELAIWWCWYTRTRGGARVNEQGEAKNTKESIDETMLPLPGSAMASTQITQIIEAALLAAEGPLTVDNLFVFLPLVS